jgi:2-hydroxychromene-2-carboxylate isomerase
MTRRRLGLGVLAIIALVFVLACSRRAEISTRMVDPVGRPTERGLAVLHHAVAAGLGPEFLASFMRGAWAEGLDGGDESWREVAARNREEMLAPGLWGVPSFRVDAAPARWGQDRLWRVERDLIAATQATSVEEMKP